MRLEVGTFCEGRRNEWKKNFVVKEKERAVGKMRRKGSSSRIADERGRSLPSKD